MTRDHAARRAGLEGPAGHRPVRLLDVEEEPGVRVRQPHVDQRALNRDRLLHVVVGRKRVVRQQWRRGANGQHQREGD